MKSKLIKLLKIFFSLLLLSAAALQYNDPDPFVWIFFYGGAFITTILTFFKGVNLKLKMYSICFFLISPWFLIAYVGIPFFRGTGADSITEVYSEIGGALIVFLWMVILAIVDYEE